MMYLYILSKQSDNLATKAIMKLECSNSKMHVSMVYHCDLGMFVQWLITYDQKVMAAFLLTFC